MILFWQGKRVPPHYCHVASVDPLGRELITAGHEWDFQLPTWFPLIAYYCFVVVKVLSLH